MQDENKSLRRDLRALREELENASATAAFTKESMKRRDYEASTKIAELENMAKELHEDKSRLSSKLHEEILEKVSVLLEKNHALSPAPHGIATIGG